MIFPYQTHLFFDSVVIRIGINKMLVRMANGKTLIRLLSEKHSDLGLASFSRPVRQLLVFEILEPS